MTSRQILQVSGQPGASSTYQYYADGQLKFSHSLDDRFDRAFSYDNVGRTVEAYSGSEARDFNNNTYSGPATGPYRQSYQYDAIDQITQQTNRLWSRTQATYNTFVNNRLQDWSYDADGGLSNDGNNSYARDAAGRHVQRGMGITYFGSKFDGDGRLVGTSLTSLGGTAVTYYLNSSVLGLAVAKLYGNGQKVESYVYAGRRKLATATPWQLIRSHADPITGSHGHSVSTGYYGADGEFNANGVDVGLAEPTQEEPESGFKYPEVAGGAGCYPGNPNCVTLYLDGMVEENWGRAAQLERAGAIKPCPDNDCSPRTIYNPQTGRHELSPVHYDPKTGKLGYWDYQSQQRHPDFQGTADDGTPIEGVVLDLVKVFHSSFFGFGFGGTFLVGILPQNTDSKDKGKRCVPVPVTPEGVSIEGNVATATAHYRAATQRIPLDPDAGARFIAHVAWFAGMVAPHGPWDYKQTDVKGGTYIPFGNFNFGVVGMAAGFSEAQLLRAAGVVQYWVGNAPGNGGAVNLINALLGTGGQEPFLDQRVDQENIKAGINWYRHKFVLKDCY